MNMNILKGDVFYINKGSGKNTGVEQEDGRPAVIVSNDTGNRHSEHIEVVYLTTKDKKTLPTHTKIISRVPSTALCEQITTVSKERLGDFIRHCTDEEMKAIDKCLKISLALEDEPAAEKYKDKFQALETHIKLLEGDLTASEESRKKLMLDLACAEKAAAELEQALAEAKAAAAQAALDAQATILNLQVELNTCKSMYEKLLDKVMSC